MKNENELKNSRSTYRSLIFAIKSKIVIISVKFSQIKNLPVSSKINWHLSRQKRRLKANFSKLLLERFR
jgi:hypothetical protein